jgi:acyl carrier protein
VSQKKKILIKLQNIFRTIFDDDSIKLNSNTTADDIEEWDSLNQIRIILTCEKEFLVKLNPREINDFVNIGEMVEHLFSKNAKV